MAEQTTNSGDESETIRQMRAAIEEKNAEIEALKGFRETAEPKLRSYALKDAGFDPESPQAAALLKLHEGDFVADALKETAKTYGLVVEQQQGTPPPQLTADQQQAIDAAQRSQQMSAVAAPVSDPQTDVKALEEAYARGDLTAAYEINERRQRAAYS